MEPVLSLDTLVVVAAVAGAVAVALLGIVFAGNPGVEHDVRRRLGSRAPVAAPRGWRGLPLVGRFARGAESLAERRGLFHALDRMLERANLPLRPGEAILGALVAAVVAGAIVGGLTANLLFGALATVAVILAAFATVERLATRERTRFESQLPDTLSLLSTSLKAGYSLLQSVEAVAADAPQPTAREFGRAVAEIRLGTGVTDAISGVAERMGSVDFAWAVMAMDIQRDVGGNLAQVLTIAAETLIARNRLRRETKALTAEGRISAVVLTLVPVAIGGFLFVTNRDYLRPLIDTTAGRLAMAVALAAYVAGVVWIRRIVEIDI